MDPLLVVVKAGVVTILVSFCSLRVLVLWAARAMVTVVTVVATIYVASPPSKH
jgi:hypothetical protein